MHKLSIAALSGLVAIGAILAGGATLDAQDRRDGNQQEITGSHPDTVFAGAPNVRVAAELADDLIAAGGSVRVDNTTASDLIIAGGEIGITSTNAADLFLAGGSVELSQTTAEDVFAAGGVVDIAGDISDDLVVAGGRVRVRTGTTVGGTAHIAGGDLGIQGRFANNLQLAGGTIRVDAEVAGNVEIRGGRISLGPGTRIDGILRYAAEDAPDVAEGAVVTGGIERLPRIGRGSDIDFDEFVGGIVVVALALFVGIAVMVLTVQAVLPSLLIGASHRLAEWPWESLGIGIAVLLLTPLLGALLAVTVVGIPLAILLFLAYLLAMALALAVLAESIGFWARRRIARKSHGSAGWLARALWTVLGLLAIFIVLLVPIVGWAVAMLGLSAALGALVVQTRTQLA